MTGKCGLPTVISNTVLSPSLGSLSTKCRNNKKLNFLTKFPVFETKHVNFLQFSTEHSYR